MWMERDVCSNNLIPGPSIDEALRELNYLLKIATQKAMGNKHMLADVQSADETIRKFIEKAGK